MVTHGFRNQTNVPAKNHNCNASSAKADEALLWRPGARTQCSPDRALETFNEHNRFVTLRRYYDHHPGAGGTQRPDPAIASNFHFAIDDPSQRSRCDTRTDDPRTVGDLRETYGFAVVQPVDPQIARLVEPNRSITIRSRRRRASLGAWVAAASCSRSATIPRPRPCSARSPN